ncbi:MAG: hypothetical protein QXN34_06835 [Archaeoglobaceae archaeon]
MIKIKQVKTKAGETLLLIEADFPDGSIKTVEVDYSEVEERLRKIKELLEREPTEQDFKDALKAIVNEMRTAKKPLEKKFPFEQYINVDLEGAEQT